MTGRRDRAGRRSAAPATPEQRRAQRHLVGLLNRGVVTTDAGLVLDRPIADLGAGSAPAGEVAAWLDLLAIPYTATEPAYSPERRQTRQAVVVAWAELTELEHWAPSAARRARRQHRGSA